MDFNFWVFLFPCDLGTLLREFQESMSNSNCKLADSNLCRDDAAALTLKLIAIGSILVAGATGIAIPLLGRRKSFLATDGNLFIAAKAFAAGVILATGFVHMLPDTGKNLTNSCLPSHPWLEFPFSGFIAMMAALVTLMVDFVGTQVYERKAERMKRKRDGLVDEFGLDGSLDSVSAAGVLPADRTVVSVGGESILGIRVHEHGHGVDDVDGHIVDVYEDDGHGHGHSHSFGGGQSSVRHAVVSQVILELLFLIMYFLCNFSLLIDIAFPTCNDGW